MDNGHSEDVVGNSIEQDQGVIKEDDSKSSLNDIPPMDQRESDKDAGLPQPSIGQSAELFGDIHDRVLVTECRSPVNAPDSKSEQSQSPITCETEGQGTQSFSTNDSALLNISPMENGDVSDIQTLAQFESSLQNDSGIGQDTDKENTTADESENVGYSKDDDECESKLIDLQDFEFGDMTESSSILESSLMIENRNQIEFDCDETYSPMKCPIFRTNLGGATITECGHCICTHCFNHRKVSLEKSCSLCDKSIGSHHIVEMEKASEDLVRSRYVKIEELEDELSETNEEMRQLKDEMPDLLQFKALFLEQIGKLQTYQDKIVPSKDITIEELRKEVAELSKYTMEQTEKINRYQEELSHEQAENQRLQAEVLRLNGENGNLEMLKNQCIEQAVQLQSYYENVVQSKDNTIEELSNEVAVLSGCLYQKEEETEQLMYEIDGLQDEIATLKRETVPLAQLEVLPETNLARAIQQLQHFYDRDYRSRYDVTDKMEVMLQTRLEVVMNELCQQSDIGDQIASVITIYTSMVQENANLHRRLRTEQDNLKSVRTELRNTKARVIQPNQSI